MTFSSHNQNSLLVDPVRLFPLEDNSVLGFVCHWKLRLGIQIQNLVITIRKSQHRQHTYPIFGRVGPSVVDTLPGLSRNPR